MEKTKLTRRTFLTRDRQGLSFIVRSFHRIEATGKRESSYSAMGIESSSLKDLKTKVGNL